MRKRMSMEDAAHCAAAWASGEKQISLAETYGFPTSSQVHLAIRRFLQTFSGNKVLPTPMSRRKDIVPLAIQNFIAWRGRRFTPSQVAEFVRPTDKHLWWMIR